MGNSLTVDSEVSRIDDILEVDRNLLQHIRLKKEVPDIVNFHLKVDTAHEMWKLSTIDNEMNFHNFLPISLLDVTAKDLVFGEEDVVISLLVYRGTNPERNLADYLPKHILEAFAQLKNFKRESLACLMASSSPVETINQLLLQGGLCKGLKDPRKLDHAIFVWEGTQVRASQRTISVSKAILLHDALTKEANLAACMFGGAVFAKKGMHKGKLTRIKTSLRIKLPENIKRKVRAQFVKNMLFRMLFNDKLEEQLEYNLKTTKQLSEKPLTKVEDVVYLLESVKPATLTKKPLTSRIDESSYDPRQANALVMEDAENNSKKAVHITSGSLEPQKTLFFSEEKTKTGPNLNVVVSEQRSKEKKDKQEPQRHTIDFIFGPYERPLVNHKCEEGWNARSRSRSKDPLPVGIQDEADARLKTQKSPQRPLVFRHIDSVGVNNSSHLKSADYRKANGNPKDSSAVTPFDYAEDNSGSKHSSRSASLDKSLPSASKTKPSFANIQTGRQEDLKSSPVSAKPGQGDTSKIAPPSFRTESTPPKESTGDIFNELGIERSKEKPATTLDNINIKKEVIEEMDEEDDSEEIRARRVHELEEEIVVVDEHSGSKSQEKGEPSAAIGRKESTSKKEPQPVTEFKFEEPFSKPDPQNTVSEHAKKQKVAGTAELQKDSKKGDEEISAIMIPKTEAFEMDTMVEELAHLVGKMIFKQEPAQVEQIIEVVKVDHQPKAANQDKEETILKAIPKTEALEIETVVEEVANLIGNLMMPIGQSPVAEQKATDQNPSTTIGIVENKSIVLPPPTSDEENKEGDAPKGTNMIPKQEVKAATVKEEPKDQLIEGSGEPDLETARQTEAQTSEKTTGIPGNNQA